MNHGIGRHPFRSIIILVRETCHVSRSRLKLRAGLSVAWRTLRTLMKLNREHVFESGIARKATRSQERLVVDI